MSIKLKNLTTHCDQNEDTEQLFYFCIFLSLSLLKATSNVTTVHMETQSWNIRPDLKARGWEGGGGGGGGWGGCWADQRLLEQGAVKKEGVGGVSLLLHVEN